MSEIAQQLKRTLELDELTRDNHFAWESDAILQLKAWQLWKYVITPNEVVNDEIDIESPDAEPLAKVIHDFEFKAEKYPKTLNQQEIEVYKNFQYASGLDMACAALKSLLTKDLRRIPEIKKELNPRALWIHLKNEYGLNEDSTINLYLQQQLQNTRMNEFKSPIEYYDFKSGIVERLRSRNVQVEDTLFAAALISGFPKEEEWKSLESQLEISNNVTSHAIKKQLIKKGIRKTMGEKRKAPSSTEIGYSVEDLSMSLKSSKKTRNLRVCGICKKTGHSDEFCFFNPFGKRFQKGLAIRAIQRGTFPEKAVPLTERERCWFGA